MELGAVGAWCAQRRLVRRSGQRCRMTIMAVGIWTEADSLLRRHPRRGSGALQRGLAVVVRELEVVIIGRVRVEMTTRTQAASKIEAVFSVRFITNNLNKPTVHELVCYVHTHDTVQPYFTAGVPAPARRKYATWCAKARTNTPARSDVQRSTWR